MSKEQITNAIKAYAKVDVDDCFAVVAGNFVGLAEAYSDLRSEAFDASKDILIQGGEGQRSITIHSTENKWYVHHIGPDDVYGPYGNKEAVKVTHEINSAIAETRLTSENPEHYPFSIALVKSAEEMGR